MNRVQIVTLSADTLLARANADTVEDAIPALSHWTEWPDCAVGDAVANGVALIVGCKLSTDRAHRTRLLAVARIANIPTTPTRPEIRTVWGEAYGRCPKTLNFSSVVLVPNDNPHHFLRASWWEVEGEQAVTQEGFRNHKDWSLLTGVLQGRVCAVHEVKTPSPFWTRTRDGVVGLLG